MRYWILLPALILLSACAQDLKPVLIERTQFDAPEPAPLTLAPYETEVVNRSNAPQVFDKLEKAGQPPVIFGVSEEDFKTLAKNLEKLQGKLNEYRLYVKEMKDYYAKPAVTPPEN